MWPFNKLFREKKRLEYLALTIKKEASLNLRTYESKLQTLQTAFETLRYQNERNTEQMEEIIRGLNDIRRNLDQLGLLSNQLTNLLARNDVIER